MKLKPTILMILKTSGIEYDDRVRKETLSLFSLGYQTEIHIVEDKNQFEKIRVFDSNSICYKKSLWTRKVFRSKSMLLLKTLELQLRMLLPLFRNRNKIVWIHDPIMFVFIPMLWIMKKTGFVKKIVWDQHELPNANFLSSRLINKFYKYSLGMTDVNIQANKERARYLSDVFKIENNFAVLHNYVDRSFLEVNVQGLEQELLDWLNGESYFLSQSGANEDRCFSTFVSSICDSIQKKVVVVGGTKGVDLVSYQKKYQNFDKFFYFVGMVPQMDLPRYIKPAIASVIFYNSSTKNSFYCEPNRMYQAIAHKTNVIVGNNPPMKNFTENLNIGVVIDSDGSEVKTIVEGFDKFLKGKFHTEISPDHFLWENQTAIIQQIIESN